ncbi:protein kinase, putative [Penicillium digitatum]|uniref:Protein kinase, putative n=1 Tax=Penicillium digitatum TaxID=36651 RepID=A0A7T7BLA8_PENDI|nr:protein kinase, putative [Penicillium digitatum]
MDLARQCGSAVTYSLKIYMASKTVTRVVEIYNHLQTIQSSHAGQPCLRPLIEIFQAQSPNGLSSHSCLVYLPLGISLGQLTRLLPDGVVSSTMVRTTIRNILAVLDFLHMEARVIHTDLQPNNILLGTKDDSIRSKFKQAEFEASVPRKILDARTIYVSRSLPISSGTPVLCDLGEARLGTDQQQGEIMPDIYRAPEVILNMRWDSRIWDLFERRHLFGARNPARELDDGDHLAEMQAALGSPPVEFLLRSERSFLLWDKHGNWKGRLPAFSPTNVIDTSNIHHWP